MSVQLPTRNLVSQQDQSMIERSDVPRSTFHNSWVHMKTFDAGYLVPFLVDELYPGDHVSYRVSPYVRMATMLFPVFSNLRVDTFLFYVPHRITWPNFVKMMGEQASPGDSVSYVVPKIVSPAGGFTVHSIYDHFGLPCVGQITAGQTVEVAVFAPRAYNRIWNAWFRDENSINGVLEATSDAGAVEGSGNYVLLRRAKSHDYFTQALPWPQKFTSPLVGLTGQAKLKGVAMPAADTTLLASAAAREFGLDSVPGGYGVYYPVSATWVEGVTGAYADLSTAAGVSINTLRQSFLVQQLLERDARGGTRYTEIVKSHFGVTSPDARLQRPEYFGGGSSPLVVTPIAQTATGGGGVGALGGAGTGFGEHSGSYAATEHGVVIGLINVKSELMYQQGIARHWSRSTRYDFYFPALAGLGEQAVLRQEIYATGVDADDAMVFGYVPRWDELRQRYSEVTGAFRSTSAANIDEWHTAQQFTAAPVLGATFLQDDPPMARIYSAGAATLNQQFLASILINRTITRALPVHGTPALLGRF